MSKKSNTLIFILVATVLNILLTLVLMFVGFILVSYIASITNNTTIVPFILMGVFVAALLLSFIVYNKAVHFVIAKFNLEDKLDPLMIKRKK